MPAEPKRVKEIFMAVSETAAEERAALLDRECGGDAELRQRVEALLQAHEAPASFLKRPNGTAAYQPLGLKVGQTFAGRFKLREELGQGGMGVVFVADQLEPVQRRVALKVIRADADSARMLARFEQERQALALMDHPNIAKVLDAGIAGQVSNVPAGESHVEHVPHSGVPYFVMELIKGVPLTRYCDEAKLTPRERLGLFVPVCQAVQHAHQKGIIHRDLKPSNILVGLYDGKPIPKVIDFGVAKATGRRLSENSIYTEVGSVIGTLEYMSPEQAELNNLDIDTRADIYALGAILYELLTGTVPFSRKELQASGFAEMLRIIKEKEPPKPSTRLSGSQELPSVAALRQTEPAKLSKLVRGELDWIVMKALEKDRNRRYDTANGFAMDVQRYLTGEPVLAVPPSAAYRLRKFAKKNRAALTTAALILLALVTGVAVSTWQAVRAAHAERAAIEAQHAETDQRQRAEANETRARAAADAEKRAKEEAQAREAEAKAVLDFVEKKVFAAARPAGQHGGLGREVTLRRALEASMPFLEKSFHGKPLIEARLRISLGASFQYLGEMKTAVEQYEKAQALYVQHRGLDHPDTLRSMYNLADVYNAVGRAQEALKLNEETLRARKARLGPVHSDTLDSMHRLAMSYLAVGRAQEAVKLNEETLTLRKAELGPDHPDTVSSMTNLANSYSVIGRAQEALQLRETTLQLWKARLPDHPETFACMHNLAASYFLAGRMQEALKLNEETLTLRQAKLGPDHPDTLSSMRNLGLFYAIANRNQEALTLFEESLTRRQAKLDPDHPDTLESMNDLAWFLATVADVKSRDPSRAVDLARTAAEKSPQRADYRGSLGAARYRAGDWKGAAADLEQAISLRKPGDPGKAYEAFFLAMAHWQLGEKDKARAWFDKAVQWMEKGKKDDALLKRFRAEAAELLGVAGQD